MQNVSSAVSTALSSGTVRVRLLAESASLSVDGDSILSLSYHAACADGDIGIGNVLAASISARLKGVFPLLGTVIRAQYGAEVGGSVEWLNLGRFTVTQCSRTDHETQITAYDAAYTLSGRYVPTVQSGATVSAVLADVADQCGLDVEQTTLNYGLQITVTGTLTGHSLREMLGYLAGLCGRNCVISRDGFVRFVWFEASGAAITPDDYYSGTLSNGGVSTFAGLRCTVPSAQEGQEDTVLTVGDADKAVEYSNPFMTQVRLSAIWSAVGGYEYPTGEVSYYRGLLTEPGDVVALTNLAGVTIQLPVMQVELTLDGGGRCTVRSYGRGDVSRSCDSVGPRELRLRRVQSTADTALLSANGKNKNFYQASAPTSSAGLTAGDLWFDTANGNRVSEWTGSAWVLRPFGALAVTNLDAGSITTGTLNAARIDVSDLLSRRVTITDTFSIGGGPDWLEVGDDGFYYTTDYDRMTPIGIFVSTQRETAEVRASLAALELDAGAKTAKLAVFEPAALSEVAGITVSTSGVNIKGTLTKNGNPYLKTGSRGINYTCASGASYGGTLVFGTDIAGESGYTPIGVIGWTTGINNVALTRLYLSSSNTELNFTLLNTGSTAVSGALNVVFLFQAN